MNAKRIFLVLLGNAALLLGCGNAEDIADESTEQQLDAVVCPGPHEGGMGGMGHEMAGMGGMDHEPLPTSVPLDHPVTFDAVYVVNGGSNSLSVIDARTNTVAGTIMLEHAMFPHHIYLSPDRRRLALAVPGVDLSGGHGGGHEGEEGEHVMGAVMVLDARTGATIVSRRLHAQNHNAIFSKHGAEIWTALHMVEMPGSVLVLDSETLETEATIEVGHNPSEVTLTRNGRHFYVANTGGNTVSVIDARGKNVIATIPTGEVPVGAWQGFNGIAYVDNEHGMSLTAIDTRTLQVRLTYELGFTPAYAALGRDGHLWVTDTDNALVVLFDPLRDVRQHEVAVQDGAHAIAFSGDGRTAYITNQHANSVSAIDVRTRAVKKTICVGHMPNGLVWRGHRGQR